MEKMSEEWIRTLLLYNSDGNAEEFKCIYFPHGYRFQKTLDENLLGLLLLYRSEIKRVHLPPEYSLKNLSATIQFIRFLSAHLALAGYENEIYIDLHAGYNIPSEEVKEKIKMLYRFLERHEEKYGKFKIIVSLENVKNSALSSKEDIIKISSFIRENGLSDRINLTIDIKDLEEVEKSCGFSFLDTIRELNARKTSSVVSCLHVPGTLKKGFFKEKLKEVRGMMPRFSIIIEEGA